MSKKLSNLAETETSPSLITPPLKISCKQIVRDAKLPERAVRDIPDAAWDLYAEETVTIPGGGKVAVRTGIAIAIPAGWYGNIRNRSGNALKTPLMVDAGIIDPGYRGEIKVVLANINEYPQTVNRGDKIAQILFGQIPDVEFELVTDLPGTDRGEKGFGSTGS